MSYHRPPLNSMAMPSPTTGPRRQTTATRGPPILPPGMPVKAEVANKQTVIHTQRPPHQHQHQPGSIHNQQYMAAPTISNPHGQQTRMSMPPPMTTNGHRTAPRGQYHPNGHGQQQRQMSVQTTFDHTLRESTRFNSDAGSSRSGSTAGKSSTYIQTPEELHKAKLQDVDTQFDQLLVGHEHPMWSVLLAEYLLMRFLGESPGGKLCSREVPNSLARCQIINPDQLGQLESQYPKQLRSSRTAPITQT